MIIQRRKFLIGLASALAAPAIVRVANIMPVRSGLKKFDPKIVMQGIVDYIATEEIKLDVLYGKLRIGDGVIICNFNDKFVITAISPSELYHDR